jgi:hypothetical protein
MQIQWFMQTDDGRSEGPLSSTSLKARAGAGLVKPATLVRKGTAAYVPS